MANKFYCSNVSSLQYFKTTRKANFLLQQENMNILKYLAFLLKTSSLYPEESALYHSGNYYEPES